MALNKTMISFFWLAWLTVSASDSHAQPVTAADLSNLFNHYSSQHLSEKIYAHTDKSSYVCGEIIWFKLYNVDAISHQPSPISKIAYVELLDREQKPVLQAKIALETGSGNGSFFLPFSYTSGVYTLRVYTNWMKNFSQDLFFEKPLTIVNTLKRLPAELKALPHSAIRFFPEGGNLVKGLESRVAFHAVDHDGKGVNCQGSIYDSNNNPVASFASSKFGMGNFYFTPQKNEKYRGIISYGDGIYDTVQLPPALESGYVMQLSNAPDTSVIRVSVVATAPDEVVYLLVHTRQVLKTLVEKRMANGRADFSIDKNILGEGVSHFTVFNSNRQPVCERLFFKQPKQKLQLNIGLDQQKYSRRQKVNTQLSSFNQANEPVVADLSLTVFGVDSVQSIEQGDIAAYFWLSSELRGKIESPGFYFSSGEKDMDAVADNLVMTHGWSRLKWEEVLNTKPPEYSFLPEYEQMLITGRITDRFTGLPVGNTLTYLSVPGERFVFRTCTSDENGNILFSVDRFYGTDNIIVQAHPRTGISYNIEINTAFVPANPSPVKFSFPVSKDWESTLSSYNISSQVENTFAGKQRQEFIIPAMHDTTRFFGNADKTYMLDDYTRFITMEEVMREYVAEVRVRKTGNEFFYRVKNDPYRLFFESDPLVLLDGVPIFDLKKLMEYDPLKIKQVDVVSRKYFTGKQGIEGIVSYLTYQGNLDGFALDPGASVLEYPGLQLQREFYAPAYETSDQIESPLPDFRNVLHWAPTVVTDSKGNASLNFYTSDRPGTYAVFVEGLTASGLAGSQVVYFTVQK